MKFKLLLIVLGFALSLNIIQAQTIPNTTIDTVETKSGAIYIGEIISQKADSIKIKTQDFGIVSLSRKNILVKNLISIETVDGNEFVGEIIEENPLSIVLKTQKLGEITISKSDIKSRKEVDIQQIKDGKLWFTNPQSTRYFWSPNGYGLKKGEGYYQNIWVLWNQCSYGVTDNFSLGAGIIPGFLFGGASTPIFGTAKFSIPIKKDKINLGGGAIFGTVLGEENTGLGIFYGLTTFGSPDNNVTFGMGYGFAGGEWASSPIVNLNGMFRITNRGYFITENYYISADGENLIVLMLGGRWIIKKAALDYGLVIPAGADIGTFVAIPWLGFTIPLGNKP